MPAGVLEEAVKRGLANPDGSLTGKAMFLQAVDGLPQQKQLKSLHERGLIGDDMKPTRAGEIFTGDQASAVAGGMDDYWTFRSTGAEARWRKENNVTDPLDGFTDLPRYVKESIPKGVKVAEHLAFKALPDAGKAMDLFLETTPGLKQLRWLSELHPVIKGMKKGIIGEPGEGMTDSQKEMAPLLIAAAASKEMGRAWNSMGPDAMVAAIAKLDPTLSEREKSDAYWRYLKTMQETEEMTAAESLATVAAMAGFANTPEKRMKMVQDVEVARKAFTGQGDAKQLADLDEESTSLGMFTAMLPDILLTAGFSSGATAALASRMAAGGATASRANQIKRTIQLAEGKKSLIERASSMAKVPTNRAAIQSLDEQIAGLHSTLGKIEARAGVTGRGRDLIRSAGAGLAKAGGTLAESRAGQMAGAVGRGAATVGTHVAAATAIFNGAPFAALGLEAMRFGAPALLKSAKSKFGKLHDLMASASVLGSEFLARKGTIPYWQRVTARAADLPALRRTATSLDVLSRPVSLAGKMGAAAGKAIAVEAPFEFIAAGGGPDWLEQAVGEGLTFGAPGIVRGAVHSLGGIPAYAKAAEFDAMALADSQELRRVLPPDQRDMFDSLPAETRRALGATGAAFPDYTLRLNPDMKTPSGKAAGGRWNKFTKVIDINPKSKRQFNPLIAHEVGHYIHDHGLEATIQDVLVGDGGFLMKDGDLTPEAKRAKLDYEQDMGTPITNEQFALEYFAETAVPGLTDIQSLQQLARRDPLSRAMLSKLLPRFPFLRGLLPRLGLTLDLNGKPGPGAMGKALAQSPVLKGLLNEYVRSNAGRAPGSSARAEKSLTPGVDPTLEPNHPLVETENVLYEKNPDGSNKRDRFGRPIGVSVDLWRARETAGKTIVGTAAERFGVEPQQTRGAGRRYDFTKSQWAEILQDMEASGWYNAEQIKNMRAIVEGMQEGGSPLLINYHAALKTRRNGKKVYSSEIKRETRVGAPYDIEVTGAGNMIVRLVDLEALESHAIRAAETKLGRSLYQGDAQAILRDVWQIAENQKKGILNLGVFGEQKRNFLNSVMGKLSNQHESSNPVLSMPVFRTFGKRPAVKSFRLDRANKVMPAHGEAFPFRAEKWTENLMPEPADVDASYLQAVESGDMAKAQEMVDAAAKAAGYTVEGFHGKSGEIPTSFTPSNLGENSRGIEDRPAVFFATKKSLADMFAAHASNRSGRKAMVLRAYLKPGKSVEKFSTSESVSDLKQRGVESSILKDIESGELIEYAVFNPSQIKSADPVTYDDAGRVVPLSKRFSQASSDIRYLPEPGAQGSADGLGRTREENSIDIGITGPSGVKLNAYKWEWEWGEKWSAKESGLVASRVSNWQEAENSAETGRGVVHKFVIEKNGKASIVSLETALKELGFVKGDDGAKKTRGVASKVKTLAKNKMMLSVLEARESQRKAEFSKLIESAPLIELNQNPKLFGFFQRRAERGEAFVGIEVGGVPIETASPQDAAKRIRDNADSLIWEWALGELPAELKQSKASEIQDLKARIAKQEKAIALSSQTKEQP